MFMWVFIATGYVCEHMKDKGGDKLEGFMLSFHHVGPGDVPQQVIRLRGKYLYPLRYLTGPIPVLTIILFNLFIHSFIASVSCCSIWHWTHYGARDPLGLLILPAFQFAAMVGTQGIIQARHTFYQLNYTARSYRTTLEEPRTSISGHNRKCLPTLLQPCPSLKASAHAVHVHATWTSDLLCKRAPILFRTTQR